MDWMKAAYDIMGYGVALIVVAVFVTIVIIIYIVNKNRKRYNQYKCIILGKDAMGNATMELDSAGVFVDKITSLKMFFLKHNNVGLNPDRVKTTFFQNKRYVFLRKYSQKNFVFVDLAALMKDNPELLVTEQDVNWAIHDYRRHKALDHKNFLKEYMASILFIFSVVAILILMIWLFKKFDVIQSIAGTLADAAKSVKEAAMALQNAKSGTTIIQ